MIPPDANAAFLAAMETILATCTAQPDARVPLVCFDESGKELRADIIAPRSPRRGRPVQEDPTYTRCGSANLFLAVAPHLGWRSVSVTTRRTGTDWARAMRELVDCHFPAAERIIVVLDNLNTHHLGSLYATFPAPEAYRIARRLDLRYTPKHGSWLNIAELELSALARQCLRQRFPDQASLETAVAAWVAERNAAQVGVTWQVGVTDARHTMPRVYPHLDHDNPSVSEYSG